MPRADGSIAENDPNSRQPANPPTRQEYTEISLLFGLHAQKPPWPQKSDWWQSNEHRFTPRIVNSFVFDGRGEAYRIREGCDNRIRGIFPPPVFVILGLICGQSVIFMHAHWFE